MKTDEEHIDEYIDKIHKEIDRLKADRLYWQILTVFFMEIDRLKADRLYWQILTVFFMLAFLGMTFLASCQTIGSAVGFNGNLYTTIEAGYDFEKVHTSAYLAIPFWSSGDMMHQGKLWHYSKLGYFAGVKALFAIRKWRIGAGVQYEKYCYDLTSIVSYADKIQRGEMKDWRVVPVGIVEYKLHENIFAGINLSRHPDLHLRFTFKIKQP